MNKYIAGLVALTFAAPVSAATVDLSGWVENGRVNNNAGTWTVQGTNNDSVYQSINGNPTIFYDPSGNAQGKQLSGKITVDGTDDDYIGFVLGYQNDEINSTNGDFWLIDWKQGDQGNAVDGLVLSHVTGDISASDSGASGAGDWWAHNGVVSEKQRATNLGSTGWNRNQEYTFDLVFTANLIQVFVDGVLEIDYAGSFTDGAFGFYNYSQANVRYAGITEDVAPPSAVPLPATLPLLGAGFAAFGLMRRKRKSS